MKNERDDLNVVFIGRYNKDEILSGPEKTAKRIFELRSAEIKAYFVQYFFDGREYGIFKKLFGLESEKLNDNAVVYTAGLLRITPLLLKLKPDLIHIITFERFAIIAFIHKFISKVRIIYNEHGITAYENSEIKKNPFLYRTKDKFCEWAALKFSGKIVFFSETSIDMAQRYYKIDESKILIMSNGIDEAFHIASGRRSSNATNVLRGVVLINSAYSNSGIDFLEKALLISKANVELSVIGDKIEIDTDVSNVRVQYYNKMKPAALADFYKDKDVFFSLNSYDTFSIASVEAMAAGLIPLATEETGISRFIIQGENGFDVKYGNTEKLGEIIDKLAKDNQLKNKMSLQASKIFDILSWKEVYESYKNLYESMSA